MWHKTKSRARQPDLFGSVRVVHGGDLGKGKRKEARPIATKRAMHVVLRSSRAKGQWSMLLPRNRRLVEKALEIASERHSVRIYQRANVGNHLHLIIKARTRSGYCAFIRRVSGEIAMGITGAKKGRMLRGSRQSRDTNEAKIRFFDHIPFSRVLEWGRAFIDACVYITKNRFEGEGIELEISQDGQRRRFVLERGMLKIA